MGAAQQRSTSARLPTIGTMAAGLLVATIGVASLIIISTQPDLSHRVSVKSTYSRYDWLLALAVAALAVVASAALAALFQTLWLSDYEGVILTGSEGAAFGAAACVATAALICRVAADRAPAAVARRA
jgi:hypothetical protein